MGNTLVGSERVKLRLAVSEHTRNRNTVKAVCIYQAGGEMCRVGPQNEHTEPNVLTDRPVGKVVC